MVHYVCPECKTVSQYQGNCQTDNCIYQGLAYKTCSCEDGKHVDVVNKSDDLSADEGAQETTIDLDSTP